MVALTHQGFLMREYHILSPDAILDRADVGLVPGPWVLRLVNEEVTDFRVPGE